MPLTSSEIKEILAILEESGWDQAEVTIGDVTLSVSKGGALTAPPARPPMSPAALPAPPPATPPPDAVPAAPEAPAGHVVTAPSVGVFWRSPEPGAAPFVEVGQTIAAGDTLCIIEVMKLMQHVTADLAGTVGAIHVENGDHVEFGTPLFSVEPAG
jgi:acetyl-CoA carboxylase biotin carboxyl carrier protein